MRKILFWAIAFIAIVAASSCTSKADKLREQHIADSLHQDSIKQQMRADSIKKAEKEAELKDEKIEFLKDFYHNVIFTTDDNLASAESFGKNFERHLSAKVKKALEDYDDGIVYDDVRDQEKNVKLFVFGDEGDYSDEGPKLDIKAEADSWFKVTIIGSTTLKIKVESAPEDDENFIITGLDIPNYGIKVKP